MKWCEFEYIKETDTLKYSFNNKVVCNKRINAPDVFKLTFDDNNNLVDIENLEFDDLPYKDGLGN